MNHLHQINCVIFTSSWKIFGMLALQMQKETTHTHTNNCLKLWRFIGERMLNIEDAAFVDINSMNIEINTVLGNHQAK